MSATTAIEERIAEAQSLLEAKVRANRMWKLHSKLQVHEMRVAEQQLLVHAVALQRRVAEQQPETSRVLRPLIEKVASLQAAREADDGDVDAADAHAGSGSRGSRGGGGGGGGGWEAAMGACASLPWPVDDESHARLLAHVEALLESANAPLPDPEALELAEERRERAELVQRKAAAQAELERLRKEARESRGAGDLAAAAGVEAEKDAHAFAVQAEAAQALRSKKARLEERVGNLLRERAASTAVAVASR
jgi:hypothetical protein